MKTICKLDGKVNASWSLLKIDPTEKIDASEIRREDGWIPISTMPAQVHDVLWDQGMLSEEYRVGWCESVRWVSDFDWVYCSEFQADINMRNTAISFSGLDTFADIYLNGTWIGAHEDFYLPQTIDVSGLIRSNNILMIHFHRVCDILNAKEMKPEWTGAVMKCKQIRKPIHDNLFMEDSNESNYQGAVPGFQPVGIYGDVSITQWEDAQIADIAVRTRVNDDYDGIVSIKAAGQSSREDLILEVELKPEKRTDFQPPVINEYILHADKNWEYVLDLHVEKPLLWNPAGYGEQNLYTLRITLKNEETVFDEIIKTVGFKHIVMNSPFAFTVNGKKIRLYGGSMDPLQGYTHCYIKDRTIRMFEMAENAHMNTLRIWGEGIPQADEFYEEADRRGFLIWQEFFFGNGAYPDDEEYTELCRQEAVALVKRLAHHVSILLWCGGNETIMGAEFSNVYPFGKDILLNTFPEVVRKLDPDRFYHPNSPYGGEWANDPREGDYHSYDCVWQYPYQDYPVLMSEHIRTAPPGVRSLRRIIPDFENSYQREDFLSTYENPDIWPRKWQCRTHLSANGQWKSAPYWEYYEPVTMEDALYNFGQAYAQEIRRYGEQIRRGSKEPKAKVRSQGYFACKLLDTWPKLYCSSIDFFQEGYFPYYALEKLFRPVLLSFQKEESIRLWLVNDSAEAIRGRVRVGVYLMDEERFLFENETEAQIEQGDADIVFDLGQYHFFTKASILFAEFIPESGDRISCVDFVDIERHLRFKEAAIQAEIKGNDLEISADHFVRCVELTGNHNGDEFGWLFGDNYFDMMPGRVYRVPVRGRHESGEITIKGHYLKDSVKVSFHRKRE